ncbi:MAG: hypothetical protein II821_09065 [Treponema sp.]|nr:hypothetical protein [Treponema sp.]
MKKIIVKSADYELYRFFLPWRFLFMHEENRFILGELEKYHPRFSPACCYDAKLSLRKKQVLAEVVVMEKSSLAQYKNSGGELFIEGNRRRRIFSSKTRFFRWATLILIILAGILTLRIGGLVSGEKTDSSVEYDKNYDFENIPDSEALSEENSLPDAGELMTEFFSSVSGAHGKVSSFFYGGGKCRFSIYGCHTESIASAKYCVVSFRDNEPYFDMELPFSEKKANVTEFLNGMESVEVRTPLVHFSPESESAEIALVRKRLIEFGSKIESEHNGEKSAEFAFSVNRSYLYSALKVCGESSAMLGWKEKTLSVSESGGECRIKVEFEKGKKADFSVMEHLSKYAYLFGKETQKIVPKKTKLFAVKPSAALKTPPEVEIGKIKKSDGSMLVYFRNADGKTSFREEKIAK